MVTAVALIWSLVPTRLGSFARVFALGIVGVGCLFGAWEQYEGKPVASIQFDPARQPLETATLLRLLPLKAGQPLHATDLREGIQRLYATGEYADIAADASLAGGGVVLRFITRPNFFVGHIAVEGVPEPPSEGQMITATKLQLGTEFNDSDVTQAVEALSDILRRNGFYRASITPEIHRDPGTQEVKIRFVIQPGARARFDGLRVTGSPVRPHKALLNSTGWKPLHGLLPWRSVSDDRLQAGLDGIRSWYPKHNHLLAHVTLTHIDFQETTNRITPEINVDSGPIVEVQVAGAKISSGTVRALLPIYQEKALDRDLLVEGGKDLSAYLESQGYLEASASFSTEREPDGKEVISYDVEEGARHKLVRLEIEGNRYFTEAAIRERMYLHVATVLRYRQGRYSREYLEKDLNSIRDLYRSNGFREVEVTSTQIDNYRGTANALAIFIHIKEGPQWFISKLVITGASEPDQTHLRSVLHSTRGQPFSDLNVATDRDAVLEFYFNSGYPNAKFEYATVPSESPYHVDLEYRIQSGQRQLVREVLINGLDTTRFGLVRDRISLEDGEPLSRAQITDSQRRLYDLGIFARVSTALQNPEGDEPSKYVVYSVDEARRYSANVGFGAEIARIGGGATTLDSPAGTTGFSPRVSLGVSRINFLGLGQTINLQTRFSTLEQRALLTYTVPQIEGNPRLTLQFAGLFDISKDVRTFSARREEGSVQLNQRVGKATTFQYRYVFRKVNIIGTPLVTPELIPLLSQPVRVGLLGLSFVQDRRDDPTDAHHGVYNTVDLAFAAKSFGSQTGFGRLIARNATYHRLTRTLTLARSTYFGMIERYAGLADIPLAERFFSGGSSSHRGFPDNQAGPRDPETGFPIGGNALLMNSVELRFPLIGDNIGGVLFNDMGNVYSSISDISFRWRQHNLNDFDYAVQSFGFGIRYRTPIGPLRVDLSVSPNPTRFFGFQGTYNQLIFGGGQQVVQRINTFQFHFSLGQAF